MDSFLRELLATPSPSGFEARATKVWRSQAESYGAECSSDTYGGCLARFNLGQGPKLMLAGHIDEIGLMINYIDSDGFAYVQAIGGWDSQQLVGQRVRVMGYLGDVIGVIGKKPIHLQEGSDQNKVTKIEDVWIDIGASSADEAKEHLRVGDVAVIEQPFVELLNGRFVSKAVDNRLGAYIALEAAHRAKGKGCEVVAAATVQEEMTGLGARIAAKQVQPDVAIAIDVTHATDVPGISKPRHGDVALGSGPSLAVGSYVHRGVLERLITLCEENDIAYTLEAAPRRTYTDADDIAPQNLGVPTGVISIPNRYMHSSNEICDPRDVEHIIQLIAAFAVSLAQKGI